ncbi:hypothetical protein EV702DRAFT_777012 [Suillus placidus]|uniref:Uncharacterized protein n=1 Tax=Suillus placidus TaxID=48579 RepID=A0A9P7D613_9AGAM|nr:hypothetical protein EV702DRAFT_777012 [Suillus placidus]
MAASSNSTEDTWHPSRLLAYDALPNCQDVFDSTISEAKSTAETRTDFYDRSLTSRRYALVGVVSTGIISCCFITVGTVTVANHGVSGVTVIAQIDNNASRLQREIWTLILNLIVTLCTESIGFVHGISLRSALASESRLRFNTNLRLLTAARGWSNPNGALLNGIMGVLLIMTYSLSSLVISPALKFNRGSDGFTWSIGFAGLPVLLLGVSLLLQVVIASLGLRAAKILTWSSSAFDLTAALVHHTQLTPIHFRCMRGISDLDFHGGPAKPSETQPSAWHAHPSIRKVIFSLFGVIVVYAGSAALAMYISKLNGFNTSPTWTFMHSQSNTIWFNLPSVGGPDWGVNVRGWILAFVIVAVVQGPLTLGLHCSELIANVVRDERQWRSATRRGGLRTTTNPLKQVFTDPRCLVLFFAKPLLHWMFGLSFSFDNMAYNESVPKVMIYISITQVRIYRPSSAATTPSLTLAQIRNLCIALVIFACFFTFVALRRPRGPQPAAYGHLQTLANLVDEWSLVMWWGHKEDGIPYCHAGTSEQPLPAVKMDCVYAGSCVQTHQTVS